MRYCACSFALRTDGGRLHLHWRAHSLDLFQRRYCHRTCLFGPSSRCRGVLVRGFPRRKNSRFEPKLVRAQRQPPHHRGKNYRLNTDSHRRCKLKRRGRDIPLGISPVCRGESRQPLSGRHVLRAHPRKELADRMGKHWSALPSLLSENHRNGNHLSMGKYDRH